MEELKISQDDIRFFEANGYLVIKDLIDEDMVEEYKKIYNDFIDGKIDVGANRRDLKGEDQQAKNESITQIMVPSRHYPALRDSTYYKKITSVARQLLGDDLDIDFDMPDKRAMIVNLRPKSMIEYERKKGFDHTGENKIRNENAS